jgi:hypothetical protein
MQIQIFTLLSKEGGFIFMNTRNPVSLISQSQSLDRLQETQNNDNPVRFNLLRSWHNLTVPPVPPDYASFKQRDRARRGQLASTIIFWLSVVLVIAIPIGIVGSNHIISIVAGATLLLMILALYLNRKGFVTVVGIILALGVNLAIGLSIIKSPTGIAPETLGSFDLLVFADLFVASLIPGNWVILSALCNITFVSLTLSYAPRDPIMTVSMATNFYAILARPVEIQIIVSVVLWLWVSNSTREMKRADRAEEVATLQRLIADQTMETANQKHNLEISIQQIEAMLEQIANGNLNAYLPLNKENVLWSIVGKLNNLLSRFRQTLRAQQELREVLPRLERAAQMEYHYQRLMQEVEQCKQALYLADSKKLPFRHPKRGTLLDPLLQELNGKYIK